MRQTGTADRHSCVRGGRCASPTVLLLRQPQPQHTQKGPPDPRRPHAVVPLSPAANLANSPHALAPRLKDAAPSLPNTHVRVQARRVCVGAARSILLPLPTAVSEKPLGAHAAHTSHTLVHTHAPAKAPAPGGDGGAHPQPAWAAAPLVRLLAFGLAAPPKAKLGPSKVSARCTPTAWRCSHACTRPPATSVAPPKSSHQRSKTWGETCLARRRGREKSRALLSPSTSGKKHRCHPDPAPLGRSTIVLDAPRLPPHDRRRAPNAGPKRSCPGRTTCLSAPGHCSS